MSRHRQKAPRNRATFVAVVFIIFVAVVGFLMGQSDDVFRRTSKRNSIVQTLYQFTTWACCMYASDRPTSQPNKRYFYFHSRLFLHAFNSQFLFLVGFVETEQEKKKKLILSVRLDLKLVFMSIAFHINVNVCVSDFSND